MKIFSNFDTELSKRLYREAIEKFWREHVLFVKRDPIYLVVRLFLPVFLRIFLVSILLRFYYWVIWTKSVLSEYVWFFTWWLVIAMFIYLLHYIFWRAMNYYMDFVLITPRQILMFDQSGILSRSTRALDTEKIKTINISSQWRLSSIFNYGMVVFLAEGDRENGDITLKFISKPVVLRDRIYKIIDLHGKYQDNE